MPLYLLEQDNAIAKFLCHFCGRMHERGLFATNNHKLLVFSMTPEAAAVGWPAGLKPVLRTKEEIDVLAGDRGYEIQDIPY